MFHYYIQIFIFIEKSNLKIFIHIYNNVYNCNNCNKNFSYKSQYQRYINRKNVYQNHKSILIISMEKNLFKK